MVCLGNMCGDTVHKGDNDDDYDDDDNDNNNNNNLTTKHSNDIIIIIIIIIIITFCLTLMCWHNIHQAIYTDNRVIRKITSIKDLQKSHIKRP